MKSLKQRVMCRVVHIPERKRLMYVVVNMPVGDRKSVV